MPTTDSGRRHLSGWELLRPVTPYANESWGQMKYMSMKHPENYE
jgi:hypothetical protein